MTMMTVTQLTSSLFSAPIYFVDALQKPVMQPLSQLSVGELEALSDTRITYVDMQEGCLHQCPICALDARPPNPKNDMPMKDVRALASGIAKASSRVQSPLLASRYGFPLFNRSDPLYYRSKGASGRDEFYPDAAKVFHDELGVRILFTTSGGPIQMSRVLRSVIRNVRKDRYLKEADRIFTDSMFSIKFCTSSALKAMDDCWNEALDVLFNARVSFLEKHFSFSGEDIRRVMWLRGKYAELYLSDPEKIKNNIEMLGVPEGQTVKIGSKTFKVKPSDHSWVETKLFFNILTSSGWMNGLIACLELFDWKEMFAEFHVLTAENEVSDEYSHPTFPDHLKKYEPFMSASFSGVMMFALQLTVPSSNIHSVRPFSGAGRAHTVMKIKQHPDLFKGIKNISEGYISGSERMRTSKESNERNISLDHIYFGVECDGALSVFYSTSSSDVLQLPLGPSYFLNRAVFHATFADGPDGPHAKVAAKYRALASLASGRNVFPDRDHQPIPAKPKLGNGANI